MIAMYKRFLNRPWQRKPRRVVVIKFAIIDDVSLGSWHLRFRCNIALYHALICCQPLDGVSANPRTACQTTSLPQNWILGGNCVSLSIKNRGATSRQVPWTLPEIFNLSPFIQQQDERSWGSRGSCTDLVIQACYMVVYQ
ncbi:hypothetical protein SCLCIDRAFT_151162 [Scleroderma citrinum Foug A]|uniref:Uncharacterized protein n=1 Tax=Scleroderma citrinum Foug A TaxID=1036808 RepID=A0A0C3EQP0_9AGAM|nr:hypothetical protein SCLCIDRAFT_151162 [Scleroderma citrinum Foug A]